MAATGFDELDLAIVDAVRTAPRASWRDLGAALGVNPSTVSRRWSRMESSGAAWVTAHPSGGAMPVCALVELDCEPGRAVAVARDLVPDREAASIKVTSGPRDVVVLVQTASLQALSDYLLGLVPRVPGIARVRSHLLTRSTLEVSRWRDGTLDPEQRRRLDPPPAAGAARAGVLDGTDRRILAALHADGRMPLERIAEHAGVGALAVRRRLARMRNGGLVTLRCDVSHELSGRSVWAMYFGSLDVQDLRSAERRVRTLPGVRAASFVAGPFNVVVDAWLRSVAEVHDLEWRMSRELPELRVQDRSVVLQMTKLIGHVLDADGRAVGIVPLLPDDPQP
ncbi:Lrp/AsnC family transcriptional regulator [Actinomadura madurae]|uniref:Lrp/AsnC family transcriptional regulator n=1 Tax=Actinomadura madurae TaxID=1993 RepID=UPI00202629AB|nr:Lrp/AsnC family transcriptional regulator [Actinomadura madurae]MCP9951097.1 Lrp/AsnC family transcriptional regulator [Actinomadura madurae]MCP9980332.1 Lrp/AsnC family transcriptional regulator [Actinomadura madurae]MCQ0008149.1 Lrp/AsnC family transcriptional regulator [Actinomadura madurae]URM96634.1 Lrp/AsnC family transcriptional regulator [Actinomadura madurae]URN07317.1 Lrp/AsnC family transcriptional regulator [Actinomadura madurae]